MEVFMSILILLAEIAEISEEKGFGFNGNILETNILNLAVVLAIVISFVGDALRSLLENRKQTIVNNLEEAEKKSSEARERLSQAKAQLEQSKNKAVEIRQQGLVTAEQEKKQCIRQTAEDIARLEDLKSQTLRVQQQKAIAQVSQQVISLAITQVKEKLKKKLNAPFHDSVNNFNIVLFTNYKEKSAY
uniref:ATP synthase subunit b, chloroplastic n=1 Tax=Fusochloris perforata TaxID=106203 RepID=A0A097KPN9_9CHLO|nr:CF0 subunit I of ATP synthase [Fusochloris perforata]AIT95153.1 CF0 subunit I of ATP synthase [Fusochloris perforata]